MPGEDAVVDLWCRARACAAIDAGCADAHGCARCCAVVMPEGGQHHHAKGVYNHVQQTWTIPLCFRLLVVWVRGRTSRQALPCTAQWWSSGS